MTRRLVAVSMVVCAMIASTVWSAGAVAPRAVAPTTREAAAHDALELLAHIPDAVRPTCLLSDTSYANQPGKVGDHDVAQLECHPDPTMTITYSQFPNRSGEDGYFERLAGLQTSAPGCTPRQHYSVHGATLGESSCGLDDAAASIVWTFEPLFVVGNLHRTDTDVATALTTWNDDAGPDRTVHPLPPVLTRATSARAGRRLLALIPDAAANKCQARDLSKPANLLDGSAASAGPGIWLDAEVVCTSEFPSSVTYRQYRNPDAYAAAYDAKAFLMFAAANDSTCPNGTDNSWSVGNTQVGRVACYRIDQEAHLLWTYDPAEIVAEAFALNQDSAQAIYDWWKRSAGPVQSQ